jgi:probable HAF family extracellular repeat protein
MPTIAPPKKKEEHMKPILTSIAAAGLFAALSIAQPSPKYTVSDLGRVGQTGPVQPYSLANNLVVAGADNAPDGAMHAVLWFLGLKLDIGAKGLGGPNSMASAVNTLSQIVGDAQTTTANNEDFCGFNAAGLPASNTACLPFLWQYGVMTPLPTLGGANGQAIGINNRGVVAGFAESAQADPNPACPVSQVSAVIWQNGKIQELPAYTGDTDGVAWAVNDNGQVVGASGACTAYNPDLGIYMVANHALLWENGEATDLGNLGGTGGLPGNHACALNNQGQVVGHSTLADNNTFHGFLWTRAGGMVDLGTLSGDASSLALGINDGGVVVGASFDEDFNERAILWRNGTMTDLNTLVPANSPLYLLQAESINSNGEIIGLAIDGAGNLHGFMAVPR